jgi:hypothetical protein
MHHGHIGLASIWLKSQVGEIQIGGKTMVMEPINVDKAIEIAKRKNLKPGRVKGTKGVQFTKGKNPRLETIDWEEFKKTLVARKLQVYESGGWMKIMKK